MFLLKIERSLYMLSCRIGLTPIDKLNGSSRRRLGGLNSRMAVKGIKNKQYIYLNENSNRIPVTFSFKLFLSIVTIQLHTYVFLVPTVQSDQWPNSQTGGLGLEERKVRWIFGDSFPDGRSSFAADEQEAAENEAHPELEEELKSLTYAERKSVLLVPAALDPEDLKLFTR